MAGKHSKSFFDLVKDIFVLQISPKESRQSELSLPFKIIAVALVLSLLVSAILIGSFFAAGNAQKNVLNQAKNYFEALGGNKVIKTLSANNGDIKGWIDIKGTNISCAVCHGKDDEFYINHNQNGKKSRYGALFLSASDSFDRAGNDQNIVIFGNNMKDGTMFGSLKRYRNIKFYKQNPTIDLYYGDVQEKYIVFSVMLTSSNKDDAGQVYNPTKSHFANNDEFNKWYNESCMRSLINTTVTVEYGDQLLTLVTAADDFDGAKLVVLAKKVTDWDASHTDVSDATVNSKIKYPKIWYTERGLEYPY